MPLFLPALYLILNCVYYILWVNFTDILALGTLLAVPLCAPDGLGVGGSFPTLLLIVPLTPPYNFTLWLAWFLETGR